MMPSHLMPLRRLLENPLQNSTFGPWHTINDPETVKRVSLVENWKEDIPDFEIRQASKWLPLSHFTEENDFSDGLPLEIPKILVQFPMAVNAYNKHVTLVALATVLAPVGHVMFVHSRSSRSWPAKWTMKPTLLFLSWFATFLASAHLSPPVCPALPPMPHLYPRK